MNSLILSFGTQIALEVRDTSANSTTNAPVPQTVGDLLAVWGKEPPPQLPMLRTTCNLLAVYLDTQLEQIPIDAVKETRDRFRKFLEARKYAENSIRTYVNHVRIMLESATQFGWESTEEVPEAWRGVLAIAAERKCSGLAKYLAHLRKTPDEVLIEDVDQWVQLTSQQKFSYGRAKEKALWFWRVLRECGYSGQLPTSILREKGYGVPLAQFPLALNKEVVELLRWKQAEYAVDRPKGARIRPVTAKRLQHLISGLVGFVVNVRHESDISSLAQLVQKDIVGGFVEWCINERKVKGESLQRNLRMLSAAMSQHPPHRSVDISWLKPLIDSLPTTAASEARKRKSEKFLEYKVLELIPAKIRAEMSAAQKKGPVQIARVVHHGLLFKWLITLPWRQRNIREMRIGGPKPNLFKAKISPFSEIDKPEWIQQEERKNPSAEFWQFHFSCDETKMKHEVDALLPRQLIEPLEEYLNEFRGALVCGTDPSTLFINRAGKPVTSSQMTELVSSLTLKHGGRRVTPHSFRDIVAFTWLKEHPADYLTLSKMLWHKSIKTTIEIYGGRFNESSGVCAMESWLDERGAKQK
jgi:integrase